MSAAKIKNYNRNKYEKGVIFTLIFILISIVLFVYSLISSKDKIMHTIKEIGSSRINGFSTKINNVTHLYETFMNMGAYQYELIYYNNNDKAEFGSWFKKFALYGSNTFNVKSMQAYSVVYDNGTYDVLTNEDYDLSIFNKKYIENSMWYKNALKNKDKVVFSKVYRDLYDNKSTITISKSILNGNGVLAVDLDLLDIKNNWLPNEDNMDNSVYILLDNEGSYIACNKIKAKSDFDNATLGRYRSNVIPVLFEKISENKLEKGSFKTVLPDIGEFYIFYNKNEKTGFISIVALNVKEFYSKSSIWQLRYLIILLILAVASIIMYVEEHYLNKKITESNDVIDMLGNSYYAIYRVNINTEEYDIVRSSEYISQTIASSGKYSSLYNKLIEYMEELSADEFRKSFSIENIKKMAENYQLDYGIDLYRFLEDGYKWVNLRIIIDKSVSKDNILLCFKECEEERKRELAHIGLLEDAVSALKESAESKRILYSSVSHDMRTPLNGIIGIAELMGHYINDPEKLSDYLEKIKISGNQLITLIDNFLETAKSESKTLETNIETFSLNERIGEVVNIFTLIAQRDKKHFSAEIDIIHDHVRGDLNKLMHILNNILSNAFKYTGDNGNISLLVSEIYDNGTYFYVFSIKDNGIGMSKEFLRHLFTPFAREKRDSTRRITGTGLGLSIVQSQVRHMQGEITVDSVYEKGTEVKITLPFEIVEDLKNDCKDRIKNVDIIDLAGSTILVAEDNVVNMQIITELLALRKIKVIQAWNGDEAVNIFKNSKEYSIDAILMDILMPVLDGLEAAKLIRQMDRQDAKYVPIIALSANIFEEDIKESRAAGMDAHLAKPVNLDMLYGTLSEYIKKNK